MAYDRKRRVDRIRLGEPLIGRLGAESVVLVDISLDGARIEHHEPVKIGATMRLSFRWNDQQIALGCRVTRCKLERFAVGSDGLTIYHSGLHFTETGESRNIIRQFVLEHIARSLAEQRANARGELPISVEKMPIFRGHSLTANPTEVLHVEGLQSQLPAARVARQTGYISCRLDQNSWRKTHTADPAQPSNGFTVSAAEDLGQIDELCENYRKSDEDGREFIRLLARLSITDAEGGHT
ncbi:MAG TPA: PilZ domain-containing protein [Thermoanaerobaculia bacterium]|nr:PilZ domain-containing protein [Thermoanaerobaculia bacterium]